MKTTLACLIVATVLFTACNTKSNRSDAEPLSHQSEITVSGAYALSPLMQLWVAEFSKTHPYVKFKILPNGSDQGQRDILLGKVDMAMISAEIPKSVRASYR